MAAPRRVVATLAVAVPMALFLALSACFDNGTQPTPNEDDSVPDPDTIVTLRSELRVPVRFEDTEVARALGLPDGVVASD